MAGWGGGLFKREAQVHGIYFLRGAFGGLKGGYSVWSKGEYGDEICLKNAEKKRNFV